MKFRACVSMSLVGCKKCKEFEVDDEDLEGIKDEKIDDYVWDELGGEEVANELFDMWLERV